MSKTLDQIINTPGTYKAACTRCWILVVHQDLTNSKYEKADWCSKLSLFELRDGKLVGKMFTNESVLGRGAVWEPLENFKFTLIINEDSTLC